ncbi:ABC transporter permease [Cellulomonas sp. ATA003]|uniref:ABC transporter permease n=1 Tax=Cellulomonas sp. ATA003 TaxID=3073064 RepID=UPI0028731D82|nr:ABC transporter permease [Cellulomonas sp. ATA003]WNB87189.1 ABC transporter permease [Cellulomonas sp. ATA003]
MSATGPAVLARLTVVEARLSWRDPAAVFFGLVFPGLLLVVLGLAMPWADEPFDAGDPDLAQVTAITAYTPIVLALAIATVAFSTFPAVLAGYREKGVLRRLSTTPLPPSRVLVAQLLVSGGTLVAASVLAVVLAVVLLDISLPRSPVLVVASFLLGAASALAVGCLIAARAGTAGAATGVGMLAFFTSLFFAGVWMPLPLMPPVIQTISAYTPVGAASGALAAGWYGTGVPALELTVMAVWTAVCVPLAARLFRWT